MLLNKKIGNLIRSENYLLYKHFLRTFNIMNDRMKRTDIPARVDVIQLFKENMRINKDGENEMANL